MEIVNVLEYPLPILKIQTEKIVIEASGAAESFLLIENSGSGVLRGKAMSNSPVLKFDKESFSGNSTKLHYSIDCSGSKAGEIIHSDVVIVSNGGERIIPVIIKVLQAFITTPENIKISTLKEFFAYSRKHPVQSRQIFVSQDFMIWLMNIGYEYMDIFDYLIKDPNKERAVENFFVLSKLKNKPVLSIPEKVIHNSVNHTAAEPVKRAIAIKKSGYGYIETEITQKNPQKWFKLSTKKLTSEDFDDTDTAYIKYEIHVPLLEKKISKTAIALGDGTELEIQVKKKAVLIVGTNKGSYEFDDKGFFVLQNNSGADLMVDIGLKDNYIKLEGKRYFIGEYAEIPFTVKLSAIQLAQFAIKKMPVITTEITISATVNLQIIKRTIQLNLGNPMLI